MSFPNRIWAFVFLTLAVLPSFVFADGAEDDYQKGLSFYQQKQYDQAIVYLREATNLAPDSWQAYQALGNALYMSGDKKDALDAFDKSLDINPNNPQLKAFADNLAAQVDTESAQGAAPPADSSGMSSSSPGHKPVFRGPHIFQKGAWAYVQTGVINSTLGDLSTGAQALPNNLTYTEIGLSPVGIASATASNSGTGFLLGGEAGYSFDPENAVGLAVNLGFFGGYSDHILTTGGDTITNTFSPIMYELGVLYHHYFLMGDSRLGLEAGPAFYLTTMEVDSEEDGNILLSGPMQGYGFGGILGAEYDISFKNFSIDIFAHGRLASTSNIQGSGTDIYGNPIQAGLAVDTTNNSVFPDYTSNIGVGNERWANVDYTGFDAGLAVTYRYW